MKTYFIESSLPLFPQPYIDQLGNQPFKYGLQVQAESVRAMDEPVKQILTWTGYGYEPTTFDKLPVGKNIMIKIVEQ